MGTEPARKQQQARKQSGDSIISVCTKCSKNFEGRLKECPICRNKAYLRFMPKSPNAIVLTDDNRERLERHCKTTFPDDVIAVVPSLFTSSIGAKELEEQEKTRQKLRHQAEERAKRKAEKHREEEKKKKSSKKS